ncbi:MULTISPECIES: T9SS type A sorting domain-containing protein [unclassified Flavobacterium]|uniref:T9SS type A sorting domain-containing protein n=1 Tax=unclassified Flavobacterium TaxID=196869 RepID=UPI0012922F24|nr:MULTISPECIES: T9SS type A sorting domain-containing protein [unclassified Flavobacterium]MQP52622.1 T9SS type A sorting domain-containing protein [Flavobacterium sp. LMO9]MQP62692.1 T9SS type A sorting domain-containing protein [Flavobacterium sp. LMO6]
MKKITFLLSLMTCTLGFAQNLVTNGDFQTGTAAPWYNNAANVVDLGGGNFVNEANVLGAGNPWDVNLSQDIVLEDGKTYRFTFDAFTDATTGSRSIVAGLGQNNAPYASLTFNPTLTPTLQTFSYDITINYGDAVTDRVIFDLGAAVGFVFIDNVSVVEVMPLLLGFEVAESGSVGAEFGGMAVPVVEDGTGSNTSKVLKIVGNPATDVWQGVNLTLTSLAGLATTQTMTMDVLSADPITFLVKATGGSGSAGTVAAAVTHPGGNTWQTLSFTFNTSLDGQAALADGTYSGFVIHTYWATGETSFFPNVTKPARTFYIDNIRGPLGTPPVIPTPTVAAPTPPARPVGDVVSIYSDAYAPITFDNFDAGWCGGAATTEVQIVGDNTLKKNSGVVCHGIEFQSNKLDLSTFTHIHFDFYITDTDLTGDVFNVKLVDFGGGAAQASALEININGGTTPQLVANQWVSVDVPITALGGVVANNLTRTDVAQIGITTAMVSNVWYDNIYLHKNTILSSDNFNVTKVKLYPNPTSNILNIEAGANIQSIAVYNVLGQEVMNREANDSTISLDVSSLNAGVYVIKTMIDGNVSSTKFIKE